MPVIFPFHAPILIALVMAEGSGYLRSGRLNLSSVIGEIRWLRILVSLVRLRQGAQRPFRSSPIGGVHQENASK